MGDQKDKTLNKDMAKGTVSDILDDTDIFAFGEELNKIVKMPLFIKEVDTDYLMEMPNDTIH
jgi:hypothetical protein